MIVINFIVLSTVLDLVGLCVTIDLRNSPTGANVIYMSSTCLIIGVIIFGVNNKRATVTKKEKIHQYRSFLFLGVLCFQNLKFGGRKGEKGICKL